MSGVLMALGGGVPLNATVYPTEVEYDFAASGTYTTGPAAVTAMGGAAPYGYAWTYVSGATSIRCNAPGAASTTFTATVSKFAPDTQAVWKCTVTDGDGAAFAVEVTVDFVSTWIGPPG